MHAKGGCELSPCMLMAFVQDANVICTRCDLSPCMLMAEVRGANVVDSIQDFHRIAAFQHSNIPLSENELKINRFDIFLVNSRLFSRVSVAAQMLEIGKELKKP
jgi:hypothetical protein